MVKTIILATGGTGGHIFPAQAVAQILSEEGLRVIIFGDQNYKKYHKAQSPYNFKIISSSKLSKSPLSLIKAGFKIKLGVLQSLFFILKYKPQAIVAFGGYSTFPTLIAAVILRKKIILHEQNAHLGKVNRFFEKFANKIALSYRKTDGISSPALQENDNKFCFTGNPIRKDILALSKADYKLPNFHQPQLPIENLGYNVLLASQFKNYNENHPTETLNILVIGGSGGAKIFSEVLPKAFFNLRDELKNLIHITQQCRQENLPATFEQYKSFNINIIISHFFENMADEIARSHLVIARSGSSSIAEFTCAKKPMILVPFALSADNHQEKNALEIAQSGGAILIRERDFTINNVTATLEKLIDNPAILQKMSGDSFKCANLNAASNLAKIIQDICNAQFNKN